jgi:SAM-dependent methyltransferase
VSAPNQNALTEDFEFLALSEARNYRASIVKTFAPFLSGRVCEVGAGIGQITEQVLRLPSVSEVVAVEPDTEFQKTFRERLPNVSLINGTTSDLDDSEVFDAALMVNVLEHIEDDVGELNRLHKRLGERKGHICILVPARQELYSKLDAHFGHFRRYSRSELREKLETAGFKVRYSIYFNFIGYFAWLVRFKLMGSLRFDPKQVRFFDRAIFPPCHWIESRLLRPPLGQSVVAVGHVA